jgi:hypothetical protein
MRSNIPAGVRALRAPDSQKRGAFARGSAGALGTEMVWRNPILGCLLAATSSAGCHGSIPGGITREQALKIAEHTAERSNIQLSKYSLSTYGEPLTQDGRTWLFLWECKPLPPPGCHFLVSVDRTTGAADLHRGE